jgi:hypothetical protein
MSRRVIFLSIAGTIILGLVAFRVTILTTGGFLVWSDGLAYFFHARSLVLDGNTDITNEFNEFDRRYPVGRSGSSPMDSIRRNVSHNPDGKIVSPWPIGMGMVAAPFYAVGFAVESITARVQHRAADSYGLIPQVFFALSSLVCGWLGFLATYFCCREVSNRSSSYLATFGAVLAGSAVFYVFVNPTMAHAVSFGIAATLILYWLKQWRRDGGCNSMLLLGFLLGSLVTIRLQNGIFGILLAVLVLREGWRSGWLRAVTSAVVGFVGLALPLSALALHSIRNGSSRSTFSLQEGGVALLGGYPVHLKSPFFFDVLFSCRHGAFHWTPVLAFGAVGLLWLTRRELWAGVLLLTLVIHVYLIGSIGIMDPGGTIPIFDPSNWNDHWKGGASFGMRYLTECTPIFAIGLAVLLSGLMRYMAGKVLGYVMVSGLIMWNGLLILAYGMNTVSRTQCVTYAEKGVGVSQVTAKIFGSIR